MSAFALLGVLLGTADTTGTRLIDGFDRIEAWTPHPADGVTMALAGDAGRTGRALRLSFSFTGGGYAIARRGLDLDLPRNYVFSLWIKGEARPNTLEFKLIDRSGENVWWYTDRDRVFDGAWHQIIIRKRQVAFAWGPRGGGDLEHVAALELVITAGSGGGSGRVWFDDLRLTTLPEMAPPDRAPLVSASSSAPGHPAAAALDGDTTTSWRPAAGPASLTLDFGRPREYGGATLVWEPDQSPREYTARASDNARTWRLLARGTSAAGRSYLYLPDGESRYLRVDLVATPPHRIGLREVRIEPLAWSASRNAFFSAIAKDAVSGSYPRYFLGARANWTVVGVDRAAEEALLNEDGALEAGSGGFSVEPFLAVNGSLLAWSDVERSASLEQSRLPMPTVQWKTAAGVSLAITAFATGPDTASSVVARYRVRNLGNAPLRTTLYLAIRPFQVNPPWQFLGHPGGVSRIYSMRWDGARLLVDGRRMVVPLVRPAGFGAAAFADGDIVAALRAGVLPRASAVRDRIGAASGAFAWPMTLQPGDSQTVAVEIPLVSRHPARLAGRGIAGVDSGFIAARESWERAVDRASIGLPASGEHLARTIASTLGYILVNRDGPAIQPGSRSYERSWIRDGALTSAALLRFGHADAVREFLLWYAGYQYPNGKIPCCVDRRGADPVPEHDSHGEFIYLVMEYYRHTGDRALLQAMWPRVSGATRYLDSLRQAEPTGDALFAGILPPSISHEGYSAKPMHSYWDDFFALRGFKDAAAMAAILGKPDEAARIAAMRDEFARDLYASIALAMSRHHIDFIPGAADLGDFDATSTTIAVSPGGELGRLPQAALERTFERYWITAMARRIDTTKWEAYTPYELRAVGTMLRLGWTARALDLLDGFLGDQEPVAWNQWPEVVWHDPHAPKFIGDLPHTWVGSDFLRSASDLFVYERESDSALVIGAGIRPAWLEDSGVRVVRVSTWWGPLSYSAQRSGSSTVLRIEAGVRVPPGGLMVHLPGMLEGARVTVDGVERTTGLGGALVIRAVPARISVTP